jgi:hypothetical protein
MPGTDLDAVTVADCLADDMCGCIYGDAVRHIERLRAALEEIKQITSVEMLSIYMERAPLEAHKVARRALGEKT